MSKLAVAFGSMIFSFVIALVFSIYNAWLFKDLWNWFIASNFSLPQIGTAMALGVSMVICWSRVALFAYTTRLVGKKEVEKNPIIATIVWQFMISFVHTLSWITGYILVRNFI